MPTPFVPYNRFAHAPTQMGGASQAKAMVAAPNYVPAPAAPAFASFDHAARAITFHNIEHPNLLRVEAPALEAGAPPMNMKMFRNNKNPKEFRMEYIPAGDTHRVSASYGGHMMQDFPVIMAPQAPHLQMTKPGAEFKVYNVHKPHQFALHSPTLAYSAAIEGSTVTVRTEPGLGTHNVHVQYQNKDVTGGRFTLAPHPSRMQAYKRIPHGYALNAQGGYMMPQAMMAMPAVPAHFVNAAPMMQAMQVPRQMPMLMAPSQQAVAGYQPMATASAGYAPMAMATRQAVPQIAGPPVKQGYEAVTLGQQPMQPMYAGM